MEIPGVLQAQVREGKAILLLGAGASLDAKDLNGNQPPNGPQLARLLSDKFLGGKFRDAPLHQVGEYAISESSLSNVQEFIRETFEPFRPTDAHLSLTRFVWAGLATTNYDRLIETAYEDNRAQALQTPRPFIENGDSVEDHMRDPRAVMLLKLHGCISRTSNPSCPLILTTDQYLAYRKGRSRIFDHLKGWTYERPIVFIGHSLQDDDLRALLYETTEYSDLRPRYYAVLRSAEAIEVRFWETKRVTILPGTFAEFMRELDAAVPAGFRRLAVNIDSGAHPITQRFTSSSAALSTMCSQFLANDVDYVNALGAVARVDPMAFYKGFNGGWASIEQGLDARRRLADTILADNVLRDETARAGGPEFILLKGHAGAGKSVLLKRMAWEAAKEYDALCLFLREGGTVRSAPLQEIINNCRRRLFLFVDDAAEHVPEILSLANSIGPEGKFLTVLLSERTNEWNISCADIEHLVTDEYELKYLSPREIDSLLALLEQHRALGRLEQAGITERRAAFAERAGRQLLVALHEATLGRQFEDIIEDEFNSLRPLEAQSIYLTISVLHRLGVPVRAGIIARIHGVPFETFKERLFAPLERVVFAEYDNVIRDFTYRSRHPHIAEIVFTRVLRKQEERFDTYIRCMQSLNVDYNGDRIAFREMVRGRVVLDLFPNHELATRLYKVAEEQVGRDAHLRHQQGLYELNRANGSLMAAGEMLTEAEARAPYDLAIKHSLAEHKLRLADAARTELERERHLDEAKKIATLLKGKRSGHTFAHHTLVKIGLRRLKRVVGEGEDGQEATEVEQLIRDIERNLSDGLQRFPGDAYLLSAESELASVLADSERVLTTLERAFEANPRSYQVAARLGRAYRERGRPADAARTLKEALDANPSEKRLHYAYAKLLLDEGNASPDELRYHLQRAYTPGDDSYDAQLLYGRQLFIMGDRALPERCSQNCPQRELARLFDAGRCIRLTRRSEDG